MKKKIQAVCFSCVLVVLKRPVSLKTLTRGDEKDTFHFSMSNVGPTEKV
jgi:hypothetical protein